MSDLIGDKVYPIAVLIDELKNDDVVIRLKSIKRLKTIATALGEERTRSDLLPFISDTLDEEDEVLLALATELSTFVPYVGGSAWAHTLLLPLEQLALAEETIVRSQASSALANICALLDVEHGAEYFFPLVQRLAHGEWFTARVSACDVISKAYMKSTNAQQVELRKIFKKLSKDETPMVRRAAAQQIGNFADVVDNSFILDDILPVFEELINDDQDTVRLLTVQNCGQLAKLLKIQDVIGHIFPIIQRIAMDQSWRVRFNAADQFYILCEILKDEHQRLKIVQLFSNLLRDSEAEVRVAAISLIPRICLLCSKQEVLISLLPVVKDLAVDSSTYVRSSLALVVMDIAPILGKASTVENLLPILLSLLKDDIPEVRLNIISNLNQVNEVIGIELLSQSLLPAIEELAEDRHWRVRLAIINYIPLLATQLGSDTFVNKLGHQCMSWLEDSVFSIREAATKNLKNLAIKFGPEWTKLHLVDRVLKMVNNPHYLYRITILFALENLAPVVSHEVLSGNMLPVIISCAEDKVPNIKFNVAKLLSRIIPLLDMGEIENIIKPCLKSLQMDSDYDVRYYAQQALEKNLLIPTT